MQTYYLKATSEQALWDALEAAEVVKKIYDSTDSDNQRPSDLDPEAEWSPTGTFTWETPNMLDIIGTMYTATGTMLTDGEGMEYAEMEAVDGYHANLRSQIKTVRQDDGIVEQVSDITDEQVALLPTIDAPTVPHRKWAGDK